MTTLSNMTALVTGASAPNGIGRACALELAIRGANVIVTDVAGRTEVNGSPTDRMSLLDELGQNLRDLGVETRAMALDVTDAAQIDACLTRVMSDFGRLDIVVNNAATLVGAAPFLDTTADQWRQSFEVNLLGIMQMCKAALPHMCGGQGGSIVNIGSTGSLGAEPGFGAYTAMKHGLIGLSKTIAAEFGPDGVRCNVVCPGYTDTDMHMAANTRLATEQGKSVPEIKAARYQHVALRRAATPAEVAKSVAFLASPDAAYITGAALPVSGGVPCGI